MSGTTEQKAFTTVKQYLEAELSSDTKHEYLDGQVFAMAGASRNHDTISMNITREFGQHLKNSPCQVFGPDFSVRTSTHSFRYTDGMVVCEDNDEQNYTDSPIIIVEVLSKNTRHIDKGVKLLEYINIPSMREYVIIEQDICSIDVLRRSEGWIPRNYALGDEIYFESIDLTLSVAEIYHRVKNEDMSEFSSAK